MRMVIDKQQVSLKQTLIMEITEVENEINHLSKFDSLNKLLPGLKSRYDHLNWSLLTVVKAEHGMKPDWSPAK